MRKSLLIGLLVGAFVIADIWLLVSYRSVFLSLPYLLGKWTAPRSDSPPEAYGRFHEALSDGKTKAALRFISRENRPRYKALLTDPAVFKRQLEQKAELTELYRQPCDYEALCLEMAVYGYTYDVREGYEETVAGQSIFIEPGRRELEMRFIRLAPRVWQITDL